MDSINLTQTSECLEINYFSFQLVSGLDFTEEGVSIGLPALVSAASQLVSCIIAVVVCSYIPVIAAPAPAPIEQYPKPMDIDVPADFSRQFNNQPPGALGYQWTGPGLGGPPPGRSNIEAAMWVLWIVKTHFTLLLESLLLYDALCHGDGNNQADV